MAIQYAGETISFKAPWGEEMMCQNGEFIANPIGGAETDIYGIAEVEFRQTYVEQQ
jgi:hypothetical protein